MVHRIVCKMLQDGVQDWDFRVQGVWPKDEASAATQIQLSISCFTGEGKLQHVCDHRRWWNPSGQLLKTCLSTFHWGWKILFSSYSALVPHNFSTVLFQYHCGIYFCDTANYISRIFYRSFFVLLKPRTMLRL